MATRQELIKKWAPVLEAEGVPAIKDPYRKEVTAVLLENQESEMIKQKEALFEAAANAGGDGIALGASGTNPNMAGYDPVLISLVRRAAPQMIAYDVCGVQPMTQPTGLIFAMKSKYSTQDGEEALFNEAKTDFSSSGQNGTHAGSNPAGTDPYTTGKGMPTAKAEDLGGAVQFNEMAFSIEKTTVTAQTRALKAEYTVELAQDLKSVHGLDAENELSNILSSEILNEINREVIRTIYNSAKPGAEYGTATQGVFDLDVDSNGRWSVEKFKGLLFQIEREANAIAQTTRRGRGNFIICSSDVASAFAMAGVLDYTPALSTNLNVDEASTTFAGVLNGKYKVYVDPYAANQQNTQFALVGYKGSSAFDAGLFYCPYIPLERVRAISPVDFQPRIAFRTRYGMQSNPFTSIHDSNNIYYRILKIQNLL